MRLYHPSHEARQAATRTAPILPGHRHPAPGLRRASRARFAPAAWSLSVALPPSAAWARDTTGVTVRARRRMFSCVRLPTFFHHCHSPCV